jgi:RNA polymerase sigma-B factor
MTGPIGTLAPPGRTRLELAELSDSELLGIVSSLPRFSQRRIAACDLLVSRYRYLVRSCVQRYRHSPEPTEDLIQVGYVGLVAAINNFDPAVGCSLSTYAHPYITGEIKRYFRDKRWQVHVARSVKELAVRARAATWQLTQELGRMPAEADLAASLGVSGHDLRNAQLAEMAFQPSSLDAPTSSQPGAPMPADLLGGEDPGMEHVLDMQAIATHWPELPPLEQKVLLMRFYGSMTQDQIGRQLGISQMQVSRLLSHALGYLRPRLLG